MNGFHSILIVDDNWDDQEKVMRLFKRTLTGLSKCSITVVRASSFTEAKKHLSNQEFTIITIAGEFRGFINTIPGYALIPLIKEHQHQNPKIIMIDNEQLLIRYGLKNGVDIAFQKQTIEGDVKLDENFKLISILQPA